MKLYVVNKKAAAEIAGRKHTGAGAHLLLSDDDAAGPLERGDISLWEPAAPAKKRASRKRANTADGG